MDKTIYDRPIREAAKLLQEMPEDQIENLRKVVEEMEIDFRVTLEQYGDLEKWAEYLPDIIEQTAKREMLTGIEESLAKRKALVVAVMLECRLADIPFSLPKPDPNEM